MDDEHAEAHRIRQPRCLRRDARLMSAQRLGPAKVRKLERITGLAITRGWSFGGYSYTWVTPDPDHPDRHRHGWYDLKTEDWGFTANQEDVNFTHFDTCYQMFPGDPFVAYVKSTERRASWAAKDANAAKEG